MGIQKRRPKPEPLPRLYFMRSDIIDVKGRDKMVVVKLREDGAVRRAVYRADIGNHFRAIADGAMQQTPDPLKRGRKIRRETMETVLLAYRRP